MDLRSISNALEADSMDTTLIGAMAAVKLMKMERGTCC